ncbi:hypothetical protein [Selenomonas sputigena]|uniref:Uncharacterized protein n=1 Tax=Selenomonas sputigena (strain ATCC 35185 / DSM 20758 / CCUG 44933 / VPI D19B-28) TaxID=546271 RepID=C9LT67_SELS3|nr:hypothetical protein [Selenomonas sputigena]EEX77913.1 hypothetical protein SELSPUOL_00647 [Selenomonas sputigena ATCC 35185]
MPFVAIIGGAVVVGGVALHGNYSDHGNYSEYSDAHLVGKIKKKKALYEQHQQGVKRLKQSVRESVATEIAELEKNPDIAPVLQNVEAGRIGEMQLNRLSTETIGRLEEKLRQEIAADEQRLRALEQMIQQINHMQLTKGF